MKSFDSN